MSTSAILWALLAGAVLGLLAKLLAPGDRDRVPLWLTILVGIAGVLAGNWLHAAVMQEPIADTDWWRHAWQVGVGALCVATCVVGLTAARRRHP